MLCMLATFLFIGCADGQSQSRPQTESVSESYSGDSDLINSQSESLLQSESEFESLSESITQSEFESLSESNEEVQSSEESESAKWGVVEPISNGGEYGAN